MELLRRTLANRKLQIAFLIATWMGVCVGFRYRHALMDTVRQNLLARGHLRSIRERVLPRLKRELASHGDKGLQMGAPVYIRIFKESREMELWLGNPGADAPWSLFNTYPVSTYGSGTLGPKLAEGDGQAPTGFYTVASAQLKPDSNYHLAFNLGFPNAYDKSKGRSGSFLMVHGSTASIGCYAMTDALIEEIYLLVEAALEHGQNAVSIHAFPFRMTEQRMLKAAAAEDEQEWLSEWQNLKQGHDTFKRSGIPAQTSVGKDGRYVFE